MEFNHPDGGEALYLTTPLYMNSAKYLGTLARGAVTSNGPDLTRAMTDNMEDLSGEVYDRAPLEFGDLKASGHPMVEVDGSLEYDRAPNCHRLSKDELKIKSELRYLFEPRRYR